MTGDHSVAGTSAGGLQLARGVSATWWYTVGGVLVYEAFVVVGWCMVTMSPSTPVPAILLIAVGGALWVASTLLLLGHYRHRGDPESRPSRGRIAALLLVAVAFGAIGGILAGSWTLALLPLAQSITLLDWPSGIRLRVVLFAEIVLLCLATLDAVRGVHLEVGEWWLWVLILVLPLPVMTATSLWWWDVVLVLDRTRAAEARLAATQERLRVATDVHDLQGHHLQVIALQLELAERLHTADPDAALEQLQAARRSVDDARQGTRDLATRFRSVSLADELANARDLLTAAGLRVELRLAADADLAPPQDLGPVIRETTTNVLRHGGGRRASLALTREPSRWRFEISNDAPDAHLVPSADGTGSGLDGIRRRITEAGGTLDITSGDDFVVTVTVPDGERSQP